MAYWKKCEASEVYVKGIKVIKLVATVFLENGRGKMNWLYIPVKVYEALLQTDNIDKVKDKLSFNAVSFLEYGPFESDNFHSDYVHFVQKAFVTNAVANSIARYARVFMAETGLNGRQIIDLRKKYSLNKISTDRFTQKELLESFIGQSAFFMNLITYMHENDRFEKMLEKMTDKEIESEFHVLTREDIQKKYHNRHIFHSLLECESMRSDYYEEGEHHPNTHVFAEKRGADLYSTVSGGYLVSIDYLQQLKMRLCKKCYDSSQIPYPAPSI